MVIWIISIQTIFISAIGYAANPFPVLLHSHNDYERTHPLQDALEENFDSVEADVWLRDGQILVSHLGYSFKGKLEDLYLKPLQDRALENKGSIYGDGRPFYLWIDLKENQIELIQELHKLLMKYSPNLTTYIEDQATPGPLTVILTGDALLKEHYSESFPVRYATRDSNYFSDSDPPANNRWLWYALDWKHSFDPSIVQKVHAKGRKIRFWSAPDQPAIWKSFVDAKVDMIGSDHLKKLHDFLTWLCRLPRSC